MGLLRRASPGCTKALAVSGTTTPAVRIIPSARCRLDRGRDSRVLRQPISRTEAHKMLKFP